MIRGIHGLFYSTDPEATRAFFRDQVKLPGSDIGEGWWIFDHVVAAVPKRGWPKAERERRPLTAKSTRQPFTGLRRTTFLQSDVRPPW
jgi:hypothetical protein